MIIKYLTIQNLRIIRHAEIEPSAQINLITGANGSGKTTFLEAIYLLARNKSFRTNNAQVLTTYDQKEIVITAKLQNQIHNLITLGLRKKNKQSEIKIAGNRQTKLSVVAKQLPTIIITADINRILDQGPELRRRLINWGVFHVEQNYNNQIQQYNRLLLQRNTLLKRNDQKTSHWDHLISDVGEMINLNRHKYLEKLKRIIEENIYSLSYLSGLEIQIKRGWSDKHSLLEELNNKRKADHLLGFTSIGPHRFDLDLKIKGRPIVEILSRGQIKLLTVILLLSQARLYKEEIGETPIILIDDIQSELDYSNRKRLFCELLPEKTQIFLTANSTEWFSDSFSNDVKMFHVEQGKVSSL